MAAKPGKFVATWYGLALLIAFIAVVYSLSTGRWHWFGRSGALVVTCGVILTSTEFLQGRKRFQRSMNETWARLATPFTAADADTPPRAQLPPVPDLYPDQDMRDLGQWAGVWLIIVGTLIWGFGDLLGGLPK